MKRFAAENKYTQNARRYAHLSAFLPFWGLLVAATCYGYVASKRPDSKECIMQAIMWQILLNVIHFVCIGIVLLVYFLKSTSGTSSVTIIGISVFVVWITTYAFGLITAVTAARISGSGGRFNYPLISSFFKTGRRERRMPGSNYYPF